MTTVLLVTIQIPEPLVAQLNGITHKDVADVIRERLLAGNAGAYDVTVEVAEELTAGVNAEERPQAGCPRDNGRLEARPTTAEGAP